MQHRILSTIIATALSIAVCAQETCTIKGNIANTHASMNTVDIGLPQLAMHSCYETAGVKDATDLVQAMTTYYSSTLEFQNGNCKVL